MKEYKPNMKYILEISFSVLLARRPVGVVLFTKPLKNNAEVTKRITKPSLFSGEPANSQNLFLRNKPNFNYLNIIATSYITVVYNALQTKPKTGTNPNKANSQSPF